MINTVNIKQLGAGNQAIDQAMQETNTRKSPKVSSRIDNLAKPRMRVMTGVYEEHSHLFEKGRAELYKNKLRQLYGVDPDHLFPHKRDIRGPLKNQYDAVTPDIVKRFAKYGIK